MDADSTRQSLSQISHLFLSDVRTAAGEGRTPPTRRAPGEHIDDLVQELAVDEAETGNADDFQQPEHSMDHEDQPIDLLPEEVAATTAPLDAFLEADFDEDLPRPINVVIGARLNGTFFRRACEYAAGLARADNGRVGLAVIDAGELRLVTVEESDAPAADGGSGELTNDLGRLRNVADAMDCEVSRWLIVLPDPTLPQARKVLAACRKWTLLATADHDGVVAGYRTLKGLCEHDDIANVDSGMPRVTLGMLDASTSSEAKKSAEKLVGVCKQFLELNVEADLDSNARPGGHAKTLHVGGPDHAWQTSGVLTAVFPAAEQAADAWAILADVLFTTEADPFIGTRDTQWHDDYAGEAELAKPVDDTYPLTPLPDESAMNEYAELSQANAGEDPLADPLADDDFNPRPTSVDWPEDAGPIRLHPELHDDHNHQDASASDSEGEPEPDLQSDPAMNQPTNNSFADALSAGLTSDPYAEFTSAGFAKDFTRPAAHEAGNVGHPMTNSATPSVNQPIASAQPVPKLDDSVIPNLAKPATPVMREIPVTEQSQPQAAPLSQPVPSTPVAEEIDEIVEVPAGCNGTADVLNAVLSRPTGWATTAVEVPALPEGKLVVTRDGQILLVAAASKGLPEIAQIGRALSWARGNGQLLGMALSQWRIASGAPINLHLLVHHTDAEADALRPLMGESGVAVQTYRRLSWAGRQGLLLEAA